MNTLLDSFVFSHHQFISCFSLHPLCIMIRENEFIHSPASNTLRDIFRIHIYINFSFCFIEYDNLIMTLSRVCFLYVTDVLEGTSDRDWLKITIGSLEQVPGKKKSIAWHKHFLSCLFLCTVYIYIYIGNDKSDRETYLCQTSI